MEGWWGAAYQSTITRPAKASSRPTASSQPKHMKQDEAIGVVISFVSCNYAMQLRLVYASMKKVPPAFVMEWRDSQTLPISSVSKRNILISGKEEIQSFQSSTVICRVLSRIFPGAGAYCVWHWASPSSMPSSSSQSLPKRGSPWFSPICCVC
jgi:hypothetical protein